MKRRDFLKGAIGAGVAIAVPSLVNADTGNKLPKGFKVDKSLTDNESWFLKTPLFEAEAKLLQEGMDTLSSSEWKELSYPEASDQFHKNLTIVSGVKQAPLISVNGDLTEKSLADALIAIEDFKDGKWRVSFNV